MRLSAENKNNKRHRCCKEVLNFNKRERKVARAVIFFSNLSLLYLELVAVRSIFHRARLIRPPPVPGVFPHFGASHESCANQNAHQCLPPSPCCPPPLKNISFNCAMKRGKKKKKSVMLSSHVMVTVGNLTLSCVPVWNLFNRCCWTSLLKD